MMVDLQTSPSTYADNVITGVSPLNSYLALGSDISYLSRMAQKQGGLGNIPRAMPSLATNSLMCMRK